MIDTPAALAHLTTTGPSIDNLRPRPRQLWNTEPACDAQLRTSLLSRLAHLEYELERLH